jgi:hypothetical protein
MTFVPLKSVLNDWERKRKLLEKSFKKKENLSSPFSKKTKKNSLSKKLNK